MNFRAENPDLARELQLTKVEYDALAELLAEYDLRMAAPTHREPGSGDAYGNFVSLLDGLERDIADLLGPKGHGNMASIRTVGWCATKYGSCAPN